MEHHSQCPECRVFTERRQALNTPATIGEPIAMPLFITLVGTAGLNIVAMFAVFNGITMALLGLEVASLVTTLLGMTSLALIEYKKRQPSEAPSLSAFLFLDQDKKTHTHCAHPEEQSLAMVSYRVGEEQTCEILHPGQQRPDPRIIVRPRPGSSHEDEFQISDNVDIKLVTDRPEMVVWYLLNGFSLYELTNVCGPEYKRMLRELMALRELTSWDNPMNLGRSKYGSFVHEHISGVLSTAVPAHINSCRGEVEAAVAAMVTKTTSAEG